MNLQSIELLFWNLPDSRGPLVATVRDALAANVLQPSRAVPVPVGTAFRRALDAIKSKTLLVRMFTRKEDGAACAQVDQEIQDADRLRRKPVGQFAIMPEIGLTVIAGTMVPGLEAALAEARERYTWADVSEIISGIIADHRGLFPARRNGGVYFAPFGNRAILNSVQRFAWSLGVRFLRYPIPDTPEQRSEVAEAIGSVMIEEAQGHLDAISGYSGAKRAIIDKRRLAIRATYDRLQDLRDLTGANYQRCNDMLRSALLGLAKLQSQEICHV